jgi:serpin B
MTKKSLLTLVSAVFLVFMLVACSDGNKDKDTTSDTGDTTEPADTSDTGDTGDTGDTTEPEDTGDTTEPGDSEPAESDDSDATEPTDTDEPEDPVLQAYSVADAHADAVSEEIVEANTKLGLNIFEKLAIGQKENIMISPLSISIAMAMTANGTENEALAEMKEVLGYGEMELPAVNEQFEELIASLVSADKDMVFEIANSIWLEEGISEDIREEFVTILEESYNSELFTADFGDVETVGLINSWVAEKTHGKIDKIIESIDPLTVMYLINAIYFKAAWSKAFDKETTFTDKFFMSDGTETTADYMGFKYYENPDEVKYGDYVIAGQNVAGVKIPYGRGAFAFYAYVANPDFETPNDEVLTVDEIIGNFVEKGFAEYMPSMTRGYYKLHFPKFKFEYEKSLPEIFKSLGLEKVFDEGGMSAANPALYVSEITHKTYIDVNEEGSEAAAVTDAGSDMAGGENFPGFYGRRPFFFVIRDERNGSILFMGKVEKPEYK